MFTPLMRPPEPNPPLSTDNSAYRVMQRIKITVRVFLLLSVASTVAAQVGPDYERPPVEVTNRFKGVTWREATPSSHLPKGEWWKIFRDPKLNELQARATANNQDLKAAIARFDQARTSARMTKADLLPRLGAPLSAEQQRTSANMPSPFPLNGARYDGPAFNALLDFGWEIDLWGKVRRSVEAGDNATIAAADAVHNVLLGIQAEVASNYFRMRSLDAEIGIVRDAVSWRGEALKIARARVSAGSGSDLEEAQSETEVATAEAEISALRAQRDQLENSLAILLGANASTFSLPASGARLPAPPAHPAGLPTDLLERRPDVSAAERQLAAATARIGVAKAEFFPSVSLMGSGGAQSGDIDILFEPASLMWNYGPKIRVPLFSGNKNRFNLSKAHSAHDEALAAYRQAFLTAVADVENSLSSIRHLQTQASAQQRAVASANKAARLARNLYESGSSPYLDVIEANRAALNTELTGARTAGQRLVATVSLIKAIGGGWDRAESTTLPETVPDPAARSNPEKVEKGLFQKLFKKKNTESPDADQ